MADTEQPIYFIGIALPEPLNTQISQLIWQLYDEKNPRMLKPLLPHVTLLHPPSLRGTLPKELIPKVRKAAKPYLPLNIELSKVEAFSEQVIYIKAESFSLYSLQDKLISLLPPEVQKQHYKRAYTPHVTLAQIKHPQKLDIQKSIKEIEQNLALPIRFEVNSLTYFRRIFPRTYKPENI